MDRTERFYKIQSLLKSGAPVTMRQMQDKLEVSRATLNRDLAYMRDRLNVPIAWDAGQHGYVLARQPGEKGAVELPGVWFNQQEIHSVLTMLELIAQLEPGGVLASQMAPFKSRLEGLLQQGTGSAAQASSRIRILPMGQRLVSSDYFQLLALALVNRKRLNIKHYSRQTGETTEREVSPQHLVYYRDNWYLDAYCHLRRGLRSFAVDAIRDAHVLERAADDVPDAESRLFYETSYGIFNGTTKNVARLKFTPFRAQWVAKEIWHPAQRSQLLPDGSYLLEVPYGEDWELVQDILKQGSEVEVLAPASLRKKVIASISSMLATYVPTDAPTDV